MAFGMVMFQPRAGNPKSQQTACATHSVTKQIARKFQPSGSEVKNGITTHNPRPAVDEVNNYEASTGRERCFEPREHFGNVIEMMKRGVADDGVEFFIKREPVGIGQAVFHVRRSALAAGDGKHGFGNINGSNGIEVPRKFEGQQAGAAAHVQNAATAVGQMSNEEIMIAFERHGSVIRFRQVIKGFKPVCLHSAEFLALSGLEDTDFLRAKRLIFPAGSGTAKVSHSSCSLLQSSFDNACPCPGRVKFA
jgi:hypothetical protein